MNDELTEYYSNLYSHENHLPHAPQTEHVKKRELINKNQKYIKVKDNITYENTLPLFNIEYGTCPECNCNTYSYDMWRGEKVCPQCGLVLEEGIAQQLYTKEIYKKPETCFTWDEKKFLKKYGHGSYTIPAQEWMNNLDKKTVQSLMSQAQLNRKQKNETKHIINTIGFKKLHSKAKKTEIICAVIRYVQKQNYDNIALLRYNYGIFKEFLNEDVYNVVENNINKYMSKTDLSEQHHSYENNKKVN